MIVIAASRMSSAISFGVFCRLAPSTRPIMRSRNVSPGLAVIADDEPVGQHARAAGDAAAVAAAFADHRGTFAGDRAFVDRGDAFDHFAVAGDHVAGFDQHDVVLAQRGGRHELMSWRRSAAASSFLACTSRRVARSESAWALPRPSAIASAKLANSTVNHSQAETPKMNAGDSWPAVEHGVDAQARRQDAADEHGEHHRVANLPARIEFQERVDHRPPHNRRIEQRSCFWC